MTTGLQDSGFGDSGLQELEVVPREPVTPVHAKVYDPTGRKFVVNQYGQYASQHPADQWVVLQLTIIQGSMASAPRHGNPALSVTHLGPTSGNLIREAVMRKLSPKILSNEIEVNRVDVAPATVSGRIVTVEYTNLITANRVVKAVEL